MGQAARRVPARGAGQRPARRVRGGRRTAARRCRSRTASASASTARSSRRDLPATAAERAARARHGAGRHRLRVGARRRCGVHAATPCSITADGPEVLTSSPSWRRDAISEPTDMADERPSDARGDRPLREGPRDQDRDDHVQPARPPERADVGGAAALRRPAARGERRRRREGPGDPRRRRRPRQRRRPARVHGGRRSDGRGWPNCGSERRRRHLSAARDRSGTARRSASGTPTSQAGNRRAAGVQEDQHRRGQGLLLRLALLPGRRRRPGDLVRRRAVRPPVVPLRRLGPADVEVGA